jgi:hypothetical protein
MGKPLCHKETPPDTPERPLPVSNPPFGVLIPFGDLNGLKRACTPLKRGKMGAITPVFIGYLRIFTFFN